VEDPPQDLPCVTGTVTQKGNDNNKDFWTIDVEETDALPRLCIRLDRDCLRKIKFASVEFGAILTVSASRGPDGYFVRDILAPTPESAFPEAKRARTFAMVLSGWHPDKKSKGAILAVRSPDAKVVASIFLGKAAMFAAGLHRLVYCKRPEFDDAGCAESEKLVADWDNRLQVGVFADAEGRQLKIDRLDVELEWANGSKEWRVRRLLRPRVSEGLKSPLLRWATGTITSIETEFAERQDANAVKITPAETDHEEQSGEVTNIEIMFGHSEVGEDEAYGRLSQNIASHGGLAIGATVICDLRVKGMDWRVMRIHRTIPIYRNRANDPEMDQ
jgi:hypothetical protein